MLQGRPRPHIDYKKYIRTKEWKDKATQFKNRVGGKCEVCCSTDYLCAHHNTYKTLGNENDRDLMVLCRECHFQFHQRNGSYLTGVAGIHNPSKCSACSNAFLLNESKETNGYKRNIFLCSSCIRLYKSKLTRQFHDGVTAKTLRLIRDERDESLRNLPPSSTSTHQVPKKKSIKPRKPKKPKKKWFEQKYRPKPKIDPDFRPIPPKYDDKIVVDRVARPKGYRRRK